MLLDEDKLKYCSDIRIQHYIHIQKYYIERIVIKIQNF